MLNVIPSPKIIKKTEGKFYNGDFSCCNLCMPCEDNRIDYLLKRIWKNIKIEKSVHVEGYALSLGGVQHNVPENYKSIISDKNKGYYIKLDETGAFVFSFSVEGLFYGIQTLKQIIENNGDITACTIIDYLVR